MENEELEIVLTNDEKSEKLDGYGQYAMIFVREPEVRRLYDISVKRSPERKGIAIIGIPAIGTSLAEAAMAVEWKRDNLLNLMDIVRHHERREIGFEELLMGSKPLVPVLKLPEIDAEALQNLKQAFVEGIDIGILRNVMFSIDVPTDMGAFARKVVELNIHRIEQLECDIAIDAYKFPDYPRPKDIRGKWDKIGKGYPKSARVMNRRSYK